MLWFALAAGDWVGTQSPPQPQLALGVPLGLESNSLGDVLGGEAGYESSADQTCVGLRSCHGQTWSRLHFCFSELIPIDFEGQSGSYCLVGTAHCWSPAADGWGSFQVGMLCIKSRRDPHMPASDITIPCFQSIQLEPLFSWRR